MNLIFILFALRTTQTGSVRPSGQMHWATGCKWNSSVSVFCVEAHLMVCNNWNSPINLVLYPDSTQEERVWWCWANFSGVMNVDCFLENPPVMFQKTQSVTGSLGHSSTETNFWDIYVTYLVISLAYSTLWLFNETWGYSRMSPDPFLTGGAWAWDCRILTPEYEACLHTVIPRPSYPPSQAFSGSSFWLFAVCKNPARRPGEFYHVIHGLGMRLGLPSVNWSLHKNSWAHEK